MDKYKDSRLLLPLRRCDVRHGVHDANVRRIHLWGDAPRSGLRRSVALVATSNMTMKNDPTLEDALDGLQNAERYCQNTGLSDLAREIARLYQETGAEAPEEDWEGI